MNSSRATAFIILFFASLFGAGLCAADAHVRGYIKSDPTYVAPTELSQSARLAREGNPEPQPSTASAASASFTCYPDEFQKDAIDGSGYDYRDGKFVELPLTRAWSKVLLRFDLPDSPRSIGIVIYGASLKTPDPEKTAKIISSDDETVTFFYQNASSASKTSDYRRESWFFTLFRKTNVMYFSLHSLDKWMSERINAPPLIRGQIFKARCMPDANSGIGVEKK